MTDYLVPAAAGEAELTEKRSRFLAHLRPVETEEDAKDFIREMKKTYHDARHNCWCYRIADGTERFSDDGEPAGSAGMPMMEVYRRENIRNFVCVVTRYFGGVLLGTGGLSRAYSGAAKEALLAAGTRSVTPQAVIRFSCPYGMADRLRRLSEAAGAEITGADYGTEVTVTAQIAAEAAEELCGRITELSGGRIVPESVPV